MFDVVTSTHACVRRLISLRSLAIASKSADELRGRLLADVSSLERISMSKISPIKSEPARRKLGF